MHIAEDLSQVFFEKRDAVLHLRVELLGITPFVLVIVIANLSCNREAWGHGQADAGHFSQVCAFTAQQRFHASIAVGLFISK